MRQATVAEDNFIVATGVVVRKIVDVPAALNRRFNQGNASRSRRRQISQIQLKRIPGWGRGEFKIANVVSKPQPNARADWYHDDIFMRRGHRRHTEPSSEISRPRDTVKLAED
jgi:hypothetical protein